MGKVRYLIVSIQWQRCLFGQCPSPANPTLLTSRPNTLRELAHNPSGASPQPLGSKLPKGVGPAEIFYDSRRLVFVSERMC